jgi:hypothetical protein
LQNSPLESRCVVVECVENYSTSKLLKAPPEKSQILSCDTLVANERCVLGTMFAVLLKSGVNKDAVHNSSKHSLVKENVATFQE